MKCFSWGRITGRNDIVYDSMIGPRNACYILNQSKRRLCPSSQSDTRPRSLTLDLSRAFYTVWRDPYVHSTVLVLYFFYRKKQTTIKLDSYTKSNESGEEAQKEAIRLLDINSPLNSPLICSGSNIVLFSTYFLWQTWERIANSKVALELLLPPKGLYPRLILCCSGRSKPLLALHLD